MPGILLQRRVARDDAGAMISSSFCAWVIFVEGFAVWGCTHPPHCCNHLKTKGFEIGQFRKSMKQRKGERGENGKAESRKQKV